MLAVAPQPGLPLPCPRFQDGGIPQSLHATLSRVVTRPLHGSQPSGWRCLRHGMWSSHNSCATLEQWARSNCLIMFLDGTREPFFKSSPSGCSGFHRRVRAVNGRGGVLPGVKQTVPRSEIYAGIQALRYASRKNPLVLISDLLGSEREGAPSGSVVGPLATSTWTRSRITPYPLPQSRFSKSIAMPASGRGGQGISQSGCSR